MPKSGIQEYYERIKNISRDMDNDEPSPPEECKKKAFNLFACSSYVFCSEDRKALLMKTSREDCEDIGRWYVRLIDCFLGLCTSPLNFNKTAVHTYYNLSSIKLRSILNRSVAGCYDIALKAHVSAFRTKIPI